MFFLLLFVLGGVPFTSKKIFDALFYIYIDFFGGVLKQIVVVLKLLGIPQLSGTTARRMAGHIPGRALLPHCPFKN